MNRSAIALGASVIAFAIPVTGAAAAPSPQVIESSVAAVQAGSVQLNAPVRVLSDGGNAAPAPAAAAGPQTTSRSAGAVQVASVRVNAPVRVLSDGDNGGPSGSGTGTSGPQTTSRSIGAAQAGPVNADAPVRVLSDGDNSRSGSGGTGTAGPQSVTRLHRRHAGGLDRRIRPHPGAQRRRQRRAGRILGERR